MSILQKIFIVLSIGVLFLSITAAIRHSIQSIQYIPTGDVVPTSTEVIETNVLVEPPIVQNTPTCAYQTIYPSVLRPSERTDEFLYIAHTLGLTPEGTAGTNTTEAFEHSYAKGFRLFEADFLRTKDQHIIIAHDKHEPFWGSPTLFEDTDYSELKGARYNNTYTTMDLEALLTLLTLYSDAHVIIDIKFESPEEYDEILAQIMVQAVQVLGEEEAYTRLIPQIYNAEDVIRNGNICNFADIIFTQYRNNMPWDEVLAFLRAYPSVTAIAAPYPHRYRREYQTDLLSLDRGLYVHPIIDEETQSSLTKNRVGVYTSVSTTIK